jgi:alkanesulfonate monooxygenase SsuD/methylene tetrahydromethanopterin reductase-like flavin-dependent oxidoreductase (luciferase family)
VNQPPETLRRVIQAFREADTVGRPVYVQVHVSWADTEEEALAIAHDQWRSNVFDSTIAWNLELPEQFDAAAEYVRPEDVRSSVVVSADLGEHVDRLHEIAELGVTGIYVHHVGQQQDAFLDAYAEKVLPELRTEAR